MVERAKRTIVKQLAFRAEEVEGTAETLGVADALNIQPIDLTWDFSVDMDENPAHRETMSPLTDTAGIRSGTINAKFKMRGSGTAGTIPRWAQLLMFCGYFPVKRNANYYPPAPVGKNSNLSTGFTVANSGTYTGTGNRIWLLQITTGGGSGTAKMSAIDLLGNGATQTDLTITTASGINIASEGVSVTFTAISSGSISMNLGDQWILRIYDYDTIEFAPVTQQSVNTSGNVATGGGTYTGGVDRLWYIYCSVAGALNGATAKIAAVCLLTGETKAATFVSTGVAIDLADGEEFTLTGASELATTDAWIMRVAATGAKVYDPVPQYGVDSATLEIYADGLKKAISGARGNFTIDCSTGKAAVAAFTFQGAYTEPSDVALLSGRTDLAIVAPPCVNGRVRFGVWADAVLTAFNIDAGNQVTPRTSMNAASGILSFDVSRREPTFNTDPEQVLVASKNFYSLITNSTTEYITAAWGSTAGNKILLECHAQYKTAGQGERDGKDVVNLSGDLVAWGQSGNDELRIWFQ